MPRPLILADSAVLTPPDRQFWTAPWMWDEQKNDPTWSTGEASKTFFGLSRWSLAKAQPLAYGVEGLPDLDVPRGAGSSERYLWRLYDVELLAHHMGAAGRLKPGKLNLVITAVKTVAQIHGYL